MKKLCAGFLTVLLLGLCACGESTQSPATTTANAATEIAATTEEPATLDPNRPLAVMEPVQGGPMLYTFTGKNGKLGLINQDGELVAEPQYERSNHWDYSATFSLRVEYTRDANGRIDGITLQKGAKGEEIIHYSIDGTSRPAEGFPENHEHGFFINRNEDLYPYTDENTGTILGTDQKPIYTTKPGEEIIRLYPVPYELQLMGLVVQDADGHIVKAVDYNGRPMQTKAEAQFFTDQYIRGFYKLQNGKWTTLNLRQFTDPEREAHDAIARVVTEDWLIVATGPNYHEMAIEEVFAVDWNGKPYEKCPLMPFFITPESYLPSAGEQGPNYYWVEHDGKRGYVNTKGEWLFVEQ